MERAVRVRYSRSGSGWAYTVIAADSLTWLGEGWSAGKKRDAQQSFAAQARACGWVDVDTRAERMRGVA